MINIVQKKRLRLCQWSGEVIGQDDNVFRIPEIKGGKVVWKGCYITPQCAWSALKRYVDDPAHSITPEKHQELFEIFQSTIRRVDDDSPSYTEAISIQGAPVPTKLSLFGGDQSLADYRASYDPQRRFHKIFKQEIPKEELIEPALVVSGGEPIADGAIAVPPKKRWRMTCIPTNTKVQQEELDKLAHAEVMVSRNTYNVVSHLLELFTLGSESPVMLGMPSATRSFTVTLHPKDKNLLCLSMPEFSGQVNTVGVRMFGNSNAMTCDIYVIHKKDLKLKKAMKKKQQQPAPTETATERKRKAPATVTTKAPAPKKVKIDEPEMEVDVAAAAPKKEAET